MAGRDRRHSTGRALALVPIAVVLLVLATAFASFEADLPRHLGWAPAEEAAPEQVEPPEGLTLPEAGTPPPVAAPLGTAGRVDPVRVRQALRPYLRDKDLGKHTVFAVGGPDGQVWFDNGGRNGADTAIPASTMKLLTGAAAIESLGADTTFTTRVVHGETPRDIVLVGGGDPYLVRETPDATDYPLPADIVTLAEETAEGLAEDGRRSVRLSFDDSLFTGPTESPHWPASYVDEFVVAPITSLWVDQGDLEDRWGLADDPSREAALAFAAELRKLGVKVTGTPRRTTAPEAAAELASVESPPVWQVVDRVIAISDNEGAEVLAHHVGLAEGFGASFAGGVRGVRTVLRRLGVPLRGAAIRDGSGLSRENLLSATTLLSVMEVAADAEHPELRAVLTGLPVAGFTGSLGGRLSKSDPAGKGRVRAKTGTLSNVHGLAGITTDLDGNVLTFVFLTDTVQLVDTLDARATLDDLAAALAACHCSR